MAFSLTGLKTEGRGPDLGLWISTNINKIKLHKQPTHIICPDLDLDSLALSIFFLELLFSSLVSAFFSGC